jgi:hypothetical protein
MCFWVMLTDILRYSIADAAIPVITNGAKGYAAFVCKNQVIRYELIQAPSHRR